MLILLLAGTSCKDSAPQDKDNQKTKFYIGTYSKDNSEGIYLSELDQSGNISTPQPAINAENASFIRPSAKGEFLIAVNEVVEGALEAFRIKNDSLEKISRYAPIGQHPCHIAVNQHDLIIASNYSSGNISLLSLDPTTGIKFMDSIVFTGNGPHPRQEAPHAHSSYFLNDSTLITSDLGSDRLWISQIVAKNDSMHLQSADTIEIAAGSGPRHLEFNATRDRIYVMNELNNTINVIQKQENTYSVIQTISTLPDNYEDHSQGADIHLDRSGKFLYASNRGHQSIVIYKVDQTDGTLSLEGFESVKGDWPRNFAISPDNRFLLVANERSGNIISFRRDPDNGSLEFVDEAEVPAPVCILF